MIRINRTTEELASLIIEKNKNNGTYNTPEVVKASSPVAAFKRWIIRDNKDNLSEFLDGGGIKCLVQVMKKL